MQKFFFLILKVPPLGFVKNKCQFQYIDINNIKYSSSMERNAMKLTTIFQGSEYDTQILRIFKFELVSDKFHKTRIRLD